MYVCPLPDQHKRQYLQVVAVVVNQQDLHTVKCRSSLEARISVQMRTQRACLCSLALLGLGSGRKRELDCEYGPASLPGTLGVNRAAVKLDQVPRDCKSQTESPVPACARAIRLAETVEQKRQKLRGDALARVAHADLYVCVRAFHMHFDAPAGRSELDCV